MKIRIRVTGGNLFADKITLFEQEFTMEQVNKLHDKIIVFRESSEHDENEYPPSPNIDNDSRNDVDDFIESLEIKDAKEIKSKEDVYTPPKTLVAMERPVEKGGLCMLGFHGIDHSCKICY